MKSVEEFLARVEPYRTVENAARVLRWQVYISAFFGIFFFFINGCIGVFLPQSEFRAWVFYGFGLLFWGTLFVLFLVGIWFVGEHLKQNKTWAYFATLAIAFLNLTGIGILFSIPLFWILLKKDIRDPHLRIAGFIK